MRPRILLAAMLFLAACAPAVPPTSAPSAPAPEERDDQQILRVGMPTVFANVTPQPSTHIAYPFMMWPLYDNLTSFGPNYEVRPSIATRWDLSSDGLIWAFMIRPDVTWPDGSKLTADDVAFSFNEMIARSWGSRSLFGNVTSARVKDAATVEVLTRAPDMSVPNTGPYLWVVPQKYYESVGGFDGFVQKPVGSGPYELAEFRTGDVIRYKKRSQPHAFRSPVPNEIVFRNIPDGGQRVNGLRTAEIDIIGQSNFSAEQVEQVKRAALALHQFKVSVTFLNMPQGVAEARNSPLKDKRVRLALNYAVNKEAIARTIYRGYAEPVGQYGVPGGLYWSPDVAPIPYDPATAKRLLAEAGYPDGLKLTGNIETSIAAGVTDALVAIQGDLKAVGVETEVVVLESGPFQEKSRGVNNQLKGDMWVLGTGDSTGYNSVARLTLGCGKPAGSPPSAVFYCNPEWDRLLDAAQAEREPAKRAQLMRDAVKIFRDDAPGIFLYLQSQFVAHTGQVRGFAPEMPLMYNYDKVYKVR